MVLNKGFTLVELAIVIVIIGFLVSVVLMGQEIVTQSRVNKLLSDTNSYISSIYIFRDKYGGIPGDLRNGSTFFSSDCATPSTNCDGNGNGIIDTDNEGYIFWRSLSLAKLIKGTYTGVIASDGNTYLAGENVPVAPFDKSGIYTGPAALSAYSQETRNILEFGARRPNGTYRYGAVSPIIAYNIDKKADDGNAGLGMILVAKGTEYNNDSTKCVDKESNGSNSFQPVSFVLTDDLKSCRIMFKYRN